METMNERMERIDRMAKAVNDFIDNNLTAEERSLGQIDAALILVVQRRALASKWSRYVEVTAQELRSAASQLDALLENWGRPVQ